ncbi:MAG: DEAD/DEAH box helicase [Sporichthyaceae bacterium]|nr:DEAD/DEAH box helicase [Sporichthyaceae bacterium]
MALTIGEIRGLLAGSRDQLRDRGFDVLAGIAAVAADQDEGVSRELLIRALDRREDFDGAAPMLDALVRHHGLYPYLHDPDQLGTADRIAYEVHRPVGTDDLVFHAEQADVYRLLADGHNIVLSAPTSFGKSLIMDGLIATGRYRKIMLVVPTIALMDETRRRLTQRFRDQYKIITHPSQAPADRTIYVLTQERVLDIPDDRFPEVDFFAIDEFYKLDASHDEDRAVLLNQAFHRLHATGAQFYLLGPNIDALTADVRGRLEFQFICTDFQTVALDTEIHRVTKDHLQAAVVQRCADLSGPTLLYVRSPKRAREVAGWLLEAGLGGAGDDLDGAAEWVARTYHPDWLVARALKNGIGIHHGRMPRALAHHVVRLFNSGALPWLVVTSTLIEGVNTVAENVVIVDNKLATKNLDFFTYNNIRGRSGRMFKHFIGKVIVYGAPPAAQAKIVDIPAYSQSPDTPTSLLIQLPWDELTPGSRDRVERFYRQDAVSLDAIRSAAGVDPQTVVDIAETLHEDPRRWSSQLAWGGRPTYEQLRTLCQFVYRLSGTRGRRGGVSSADQLATRLDILRRSEGDVRTMVEAQMEYSRAEPDEAVEDVLDFLRHWPGHLFPRLVMTLQSITEDVLPRYGLPTGDYGHYAGAVEAQFRPPVLTTLEEYGLPAPLALRLLRHLPRLRGIAQLDDLLAELRRLRQIPGLTPFEQEMLDDTIRGL